MSITLPEEIEHLTKNESSSYIEFDTLCSTLKLSPEELETDLNGLLEYDRVKIT